MQQRRYLLLLHDAVRSHVASLDSRQKGRLREKLEFLRNGMWDGGVRVKKLRGGRSSFEARVTRGDRILFTLGRPPAADAPGGAAGGGNATRIYVWGVVKHDDVSAAERRIVAANAPFLDFRADEPEPLELSDPMLDDLADEHVGAAFERPHSAPPADSGDGPDAGEPDAGPQRWLVVDEEEWRRLEAAEDPDSVQLYLFLTGEQARLLRTEPPVLLSGTAGSGKTTIAVYYLLRHRARQLAGAAGAGADRDGPEPDDASAAAAASAAAGERALFVTGSPHLKRFSERIYRGLVAATDLEAAPQAARFATFAELLREILPAGGRTDGQAPAGLREFRDIVHNHPGANRYDAELVWEEIRSIIKGAKPPVSRRRFAELAERFDGAQVTMRERAELAEYLVRLGNLELGDKLDALRERRTSFASLQEFAAGVRDAGAPPSDEQRSLLNAALRLLEKQAARLDQPLLTLREYQSLGRKRAPNFPFDRNDIYRIAEYYQDRLTQTDRCDEIDLTRAALQRLEQDGDRFRYDLVVCDEVQDFTDVQLALLFRLAADPLRTVLAGDPKQIINPSGFRWEEVRARYYERGLRVPEVVNLSVNFRSVGNIVALANELLALKRSLVGLAGGEIAERWTFRGRPPLLVDGVSEAELLRTMRRAGAGQVVLVRTPAERDRLRAALGTELVFTINDAKGLEFDAVLLWRFTESDGSAARWRRIAQEGRRDDADAPRIRHEINLLYVAVTRARNTLVIWDGPAAGPVWTAGGLAGHVFRSGDAQALATLWQRVSSPAEWEAQGDYFYEREHFPAAEECYRNAAAQAKEELARAHRLERAGDHRAAAGLFAGRGYPERAAVNLERGNAYREAAREWRRAGDESRALACDARRFEADGRYVKAAARWRQLGDQERMVSNWERAGEHRLLAEHYLDGDRRADAARHLKLAGDHAAAAAQFRRAGLLQEAAQEFERSGQHRKAVPLYRRLKDDDALLRCLLRIEAYHDAGLLFEKQDNLDRAIECFRAYARSAERNREDLERRLAAISPKRPGIKAAVRLAALNRFEEAARIFERRQGQRARAVDLYRQAGAHASAATCLARNGQYREAAQEIALTGDPQRFDREIDYLCEFVLHAWEGRHARVDLLGRIARRLRAAGEHERALAHFLALESVVAGPGKEMYADDACGEYERLERHEEAIRFFLRLGFEDTAAAYLDARPGLVLPLAAVEWLVRGVNGPPAWVWERSDGYLEIVIRLLHASLFRGTESDRRERIATILITLPTHYVMTVPLLDEMGEMLIDLRLLNQIVMVMNLRTADHYRSEEQMRRLDPFVSRLERAIRDTGDPELQLCAVVDDLDKLDAQLPGVTPTAGNYLLFARSPTHYPAAVEVLRGLGNVEQAATLCRAHGDRIGAARLLEASGNLNDLKEASRVYRDAGRFDDARRCCEAANDEVGLARVYEREGRYADALAIWQRRGRQRDVARVIRKIGQPPLISDPPPDR